MIEEMEIKMRNLLQEVRHTSFNRGQFKGAHHLSPLLKVYFGKTRDVVFDLRSLDDLEKARRQRELQKELVGLIKR